MAAELKCYAYLHGGGVSDDVRDVTPRFISGMLEIRENVYIEHYLSGVPLPFCDQNPSCKYCWRSSVYA